MKIMYFLWSALFCTVCLPLLAQNSQQQTPIQQQLLNAPIFYQNQIGGNNNNNETSSSNDTLPKLQPRTRSVADNTKARIQVALLLDTSNSMDGLIEQAKSQLWKIVNELSHARDAQGNAPDMDIALYEYGNDGLSAKGNYIRMVSPMTTDVDFISEQLFALRTNGGSEYCGAVIHEAVDSLVWNRHNDDLRLVFIAGNEPFTQGPVNYQTACKAALAKGIVINTIFCGNIDEGRESGWKDGADCSEGHYLNINSDAVAVHIDAPQDSLINQLNQKLNDTYIAYSSYGMDRKKMQVKQDQNAMMYGSANNAQRAVAKSSAKYKNDDWDLVDAAKEKGGASAVLEVVEDAYLPEEMKNMSKEERVKFVEQKAKERSELQTQIQNLDAERRKYVAEKERAIAQNGEQTLDNALLMTIRKQAIAKNYKFKD